MAEKDEVSKKQPTDSIETEALAQKVKNLSVIPVDGRQLEILRFRFPEETKELEAFQATEQLKDMSPWAVSLAWDGRSRLPTYLKIDAEEVRSGQNGVIYTLEGKAVGRYIRLIDDYQSDHPHQKMIVMGSRKLRPQIR